ncbi:uncharacterized protein LOC123450278 [Hordeum vulgare subsp. vulgare]|uniref:uncharacterized protein LOC123450278 n=1 Tax=Hordeum vulgare subsp. vulgare TaxID=112509 RepID=UPI001D1A5B4D|nr:uncharacterized protein LOC123450278 [Hordeum vulgare subsp. vulgare]
MALSYSFPFFHSLPSLVSPLRAAVEQDAVSLVRRVARVLNCWIFDLVALLFRHKSAGSLGAVAGFAIAVVFAWKFLRSSSPVRLGGCTRVCSLPLARCSPVLGCMEIRYVLKLTWCNCNANGR